MFVPRAASVSRACPRHARCMASKAPEVQPRARASPTEPSRLWSPRTQVHVPRPMLDYERLTRDPDATAQNILDRDMPMSPDVATELLALRQKAKALERELVALRTERGTLGTTLQTSQDAGEKAAAAKRAKEIKAQVRALEPAHRAAEAAQLQVGLSLPNFSLPGVPVGPEENAVEVETFGPAPVPADGARDHVRIAERFGWLDGPASAIATGASWPFLIGALAQLEHALVGYALDRAVCAGFQPVSPPDVVAADIAGRCGFSPRDGPGECAPRQTYALESHGDRARQLCLTGTAEVPLAALFANRALPGNFVPSRVVGVGKAFRAEAGARGADTRGLYRVHQFTKVELFAVSKPSQSEAVMKEICALQKQIVEGLGLSVRVLDMPTRELGASAARKYDMEAWMPGRGKWGEITSTSNCTDFQARRLLIRCDDHEGCNFVHTLNGTAAAVPRLIVALLENGARIEDGEAVAVQLPKILQRYWVGNTPEGIEWK